MSICFCDRGFRNVYTAHESISRGDICQIGSDSKVWVSSNTNVTTSQGNMMIALENIETDAQGHFLLWGVYDSTGLTPGALQYLGTSGTFTETKPSGDCTIRILGYNISSTEFFFNPNKTFIETTNSQVSSVMGTSTPSGGGSSSMPMIILTKSSSVNQNVGGANGTEVWWTWDGETKKDTGFTHSNSTNSGRVQVDADGWYEVTFLGGAQTTGSARTTLQGIYRINGGTTQRGGSLRNYARGANYGNMTAGLIYPIYMTNGQYIEVGTRVEDTDGVYTINTSGGEISDDCHLFYIKKVG